MALNFGNKVADGGTSATGILTASEFNSLVSAVNNNTLAEVTVSGDTPTQTLAPNTFYKFTGSITAMTLTLGTAIGGLANYYSFSFTAGAANPTISISPSVTWSSEPTIASGDYVEVIIKDTKASAMIW